MKKQLLSMTAIVAVGLMGASGTALAKAKAPKISLGGYTTAGWTYADNGDVGDKNTGGLSNIWDSEVYFKISGKLDNGVKISAQMDMEGGAANEADNIDDAWLKFSGGFGELILGMSDSASMRIVTGNQGDWATGVYSMAFERANIVPAPTNFEGGGPGFAVRATLGDSDDPKTVYISPKMGGFQFGVSYMKDGGKGANDIVSQTSSSTNAEDHWTAGIKYDGKMGKMKLGVSAGYLVNTIPALGDEKSAVVAGLSVENGPWKVGLGMHSQDDPSSAAGSSSTDGQAWSAGVKYTSGAHKYSLTTFHGKIAGDPNVTGDDESTSWMLAHNYAVSAGVTWMNALVHSDYDGEGTGATQDHKGMGVHSSVKFSF